jgi:LmbE family N-acetylglucosaminyl deacetylase
MSEWNVVVAPHHDDEVLGCGGTICRLTSVSGYKVAVIYMTAGSVDTSNTDAGEASYMHEAEARAVGQILGVSEQIFLRHPDRALVYTWEIVTELVTHFRRLAPIGIFAPHPGERDRDHRVTNEMVREAAMLSRKTDFPDLGQAIAAPRLMFYEVWTPLISIHYREDITPYVDLKRQALEVYSSKFSPEVVPHLLGLNAYRNALHNRIGYTEVFQFAG